MSQELNPFCHSKELNLLLLFHDAKNWTLKILWLQEFKIFLRLGRWNFFFNLNQRIKRFFNCCSKMMDPFLNMTHKLFCIFTQRIGFSSTIWCKIQRNEPSFNKWVEDLNFLLEICLIRIKLFEKYSKNWLSEKISMKVKKLFDDSKKLNSFLNMTYRTEPFFPTWLTEIEPFFSTWLWQIFDTKNRIFFHKYDPKNRFFFFENMFKDFVSMIHRIELFFQYYFKNGTLERMTQKKVNLLIHMTQGIEPFSNMTQRVDPFFFFKISRKRIKHFSCDLTQRTEFFFSIWLWELNLFFSIWVYSLNPILILTLRIELFQYLKIFSIEFTDLHPFQSGLKELNWISKIWLKELNLFWNLTQWIEPSAQKDSKNWTQKDYLTPTTKLFLWLEELNVLFYFNQRIEPFSKISLKLLDFLKWLTE